MLIISQFTSKEAEFVLVITVAVLIGVLSLGRQKIHQSLAAELGVGPEKTTLHFTERPGGFGS